MTRSEFSRKVANDTNESYVQAEKWTNAVLDSLADALITENEVRLRGLGQFAHVGRKARVGRNASTGEPIAIPPKTVVKFIPAIKIADEVRDIPIGN